MYAFSLPSSLPPTIPHPSLSDLKSMTGILNNLFYLTPNRKLLYVTDIRGSSSQSGPPFNPSHKLEHLSCFLPGVLALGAHLIPESLDGHIIFPTKSRERHLWAARGLVYTCWVSYADSATGLGPDGLRMENQGGGEKWVDALGKWEGDGRVGNVPGLGEDDEGWTKEDGKDYVSVAGYYLRPEVWSTSFVHIYGGWLMRICRLSRVCMFYGKRRESKSGVIAAGGYSMRSMRMLRRSMGMRV
jgi:mannosyl-oligosaccharide alpha-1,2-mannosidase